MGLTPALGASAAGADGVRLAFTLGDGASAGGGYTLAPLPGPMTVLDAGGARLGGRVGALLPFPPPQVDVVDDPQVFLPLVGN